MTYLKLMTSVVAVSMMAAVSGAHAAQTIDPNNPNVTNQAVDEDGKRDISSRFKECKQLQTSLKDNATEQHMSDFNVQCAEFLNTETGQLSIPDNPTEQNLNQ